MPLEWQEEPFGWVSPRRFGVERRYVGGPVDRMSTTLDLAPREQGGTRLTYEIRVLPRRLLGRIVVPVGIGLVGRRRFARVFRAYDAAAALSRALPPPGVRVADGAAARIRAARGALAASAGRELVDRLCALVEHDDDLRVAKIRPYELADRWQAERRDVLELCLEATRAGLLELRWELLCPLCRGAAAAAESLDGVAGTRHCDTCKIEFGAEFDRSVEVVFRPCAAIREVPALDFCVAGPQVTPHVVAQQLLPPGDRRPLSLRLEAGNYRVRALGLPGMLPVVVSSDGATEADVRLEEAGWPPGPLALAGEATVTLVNGRPEERLMLLERTAWSDRAVTASEVTTLQLFRDLFSSEALRPGAPISVGNLAVCFTDLRGSTRYYREVGDAPAFGAVLDHLDLLRDAVAAEGGAVVKAMGDAIMAVFTRPVSAVRAMQAARQALGERPLALKAGIHYGSCIAVSQNGVLDYFGSTVNLAARLVSLSSGTDVVVSAAVLQDPEVAALSLAAESVQAPLKGFEGEALELWSLRG